MIPFILEQLSCSGCQGPEKQDLSLSDNAFQTFLHKVPICKNKLTCLLSSSPFICPVLKLWNVLYLQLTTQNCNYVIDSNGESLNVKSYVCFTCPQL